MQTLARAGALSALAVTLLAVAPLAHADTASTSAPARTIEVLGTDAPVARTVSVARRVDRDCVAALRDGAGVAAPGYLAPADGELRVRLRGARNAGDWDLAVFERTSGTRVASSAGFGADEVATVMVREGASLVLQACRRDGAARTARLTTQFTRLDLNTVPKLSGAVSLVDVALKDRGALARLQATGLDVTHDVDANSAKVMTYGDADRARLRAAGFTARTLVQDVVASDLAASLRDRRAGASLRQTPAGGALPPGRTEYRQYEDYQRELKEIADKYPKLVRGFALKHKTFQGRELQVLEIAHDVGRKDDGRPTFILNGLHHAREWPAAESIMEFAWDLVKNDGTDPRITNLLDKVRLLVMPITNADGFIVSRTSPDPDPDEATIGSLYSLATGVVVMGGSLAYKRKNCNPGVPVPAIPCEFAIGTDPNRNYAESWGGPGAGTNPNDQSYRGTGPISEPEVLAVRELVSNTNPTALLTIHNVAALVLRPPGLHTDGFAPDEPALKALGAKMAAATGYTNQYGWELYDTTGTTDDWSYAATGGFGYTIELGPVDGVFHGAYQGNVIDQYVGVDKQAGKGVREAYLLAAEAARVPEYTSRVAGRSLPGRTLRLKKTFETETYDVCAVVDPLPVNTTLITDEDPTSCVGNLGVQKVPEALEFTTVVPASGTFEWWVNPSTRPFVAKEGKREEYTLTCENAGKVETTQKLFVARGETAQVELPCGGTLPPLASTAKPPVGLRARLGALTGRASTFNRRRRASVRVSLSGGSLSNVRVRLLPRKGTRILAEARSKKLTRSRTLTLRLRKGVRLRRGTYRLRLTGVQAKGSPVTVTRVVRLR
jgi:hypothetical protein